MSAQTELLVALTARINAREIDGVEDMFTDDFALHDPNAPHWPRGRAGGKRMAQAIVDLGPDSRIEALDMMEDGDRVAVRWLFRWTHEGAPHVASAVAIYRFADGLIAEDWGVVARAPWP